MALFDSKDATDDAASALRATGHSVEVLEGEDGRRRLEPEGDEERFFASLKSAFEAALGDEDRILDKVDRELALDGSFVVVESSEEDAADIAGILKEHGGHYLWHFDKWTYVSLGGGAER